MLHNLYYLYTYIHIYTYFFKTSNEKILLLIVNLLDGLLNGLSQNALKRVAMVPIGSLPLNTRFSGNFTTLLLGPRPKPCKILSINLVKKKRGQKP